MTPTAPEPDNDLARARNTLATVIDGVTPRAGAQLLSLLGTELTIVARDAEDSATGANALRHINEIQHRIHGQVSALLHDDTTAYPSGVFVAFLHGAGHPPLEQAIANAIERALRRFHSLASD